MEVRYIEIKTGPAGQIIRAYTPEQYKKEMARRKNAAARARKLTRLQERVGAALAMLGFLMLLGAGGCYAERLTKVPQTAIFEWYCVLKLHRTAEADTCSADIGEEETQCEPIST